MKNTSTSAKQGLGTFSKEKAELLRLLLEERSRKARRIRCNPRSENRPVRFPASWAQQRLWFIDQLEGGSAGYYIPISIRFHGTLDPGVLQRTLNAIVQRHEVLRTVFTSTDGEPMQEIAAEGWITLKMVNLGGYAASDLEVQLRFHKIEESHAKFDLSTGPLIRARLLRIGAEEHVLLVTMHHIVSDGWSIGVFISEFAELYEAFRSGSDPLPTPLIQYADYAQWQREWLRGPELEEQLAYWRTQLASAAPQLELPTDRPRPAVQTYRGENVPVILDAQLHGKLKALAQRHEMTLFMVLYAAWSILLARLSGQADVVVGTPVANRRRPELEGLIGFFVNTLALRVHVQGDLQIAEFLEHVKKVTLGAYGHQDVPFEKVVEALQPERSLSRNPIFQVMFALQNAPKSDLRLPGLTATSEDGVDDPSVFDLFVSLEERGEQIVGYVNFAFDLFDRATVERWIACFMVLLQGLARAPRGRIGDLPILPAEERRQVIESFNATRTDYPQQKLIHELFEKQVDRNPDAIAVMYEGRTLRYAELNSRANQLARYLRQAGAGPDQLVGICVGRSLEMVVVLLGVLKSGAAYIPLDPNYPPERLQYMVEDAKPLMVVTQRELRPRLPTMRAEVIVLDEKLKDVADNIDENLAASALGLTSKNLVYVIYTSGSTGRPKGTAMSHHSMANLIEWHRKTFGTPEGLRVLQFAALSFDVAFQETFSTLCTGGTLVLLDEWIRKDARALAEFLSLNSVERLFIPPLMLQSLAECCQSANAVPRTLKDVITAGEQLRISGEIMTFFKQLPACRLHNHYGPTETHVVTALTLSGDPERWPSLPAIGQPISNTRIYVLDSHRQPVPIGVAGEIYIGGANVARGYLRRPELTEQRFIRDPYSSAADGRLYKTGDLGRWRADGMLEYLGRNDDQVKIRGFRVELGEIEARLVEHAKVKEAAVIAREDTPTQKRLVAYFTAHSESEPSVDELYAHLKSALPDYIVPSAIVKLERMPLTPSGKLNRRALPAPERGAFVSREYEAPQGTVERTVAEIWQELLSVDHIGRRDNFFELGGHSMLAMKLIARVVDRLGVRLSVGAVFRRPTVEQIANSIASLQSQSSGEPVTRGIPARSARCPAERPGLYLAPLAFTQLQHWNLYQLSERSTFRFVASASRLSGPMEIDAFRKSVAEVVRRHDALRTRIVFRSGVPMQEISESIPSPVEIDDLTAVHESELDTEVIRRIESIILRPIDAAVTPLFEVCLLRTRDKEHVLIVAMEHIISDGASLRIFVHDLLTAYEQCVRGFGFSLPQIATQFAEYAADQQNSESLWIEKHGRYWQERLFGCGRLRFPIDEAAPTVGPPGWSIAPVRIDKKLKQKLHEWARLRGSTLVMSVLTAYVALVLKWCRASEGVIQYMDNSRVLQNVENTIGFFASPLHLRMGLLADDSFKNLLERVMMEYCNAHEHADFSYMEAQLPRPDFTRTTGFNWIPQGSMRGTLDGQESDKMLTCSVILFDQPILRVLERDSEPFMLLYDTDDDAAGGVYFPLSRFSAETMRRFAQSFILFLEELLKRPDVLVKDIVLL